MFRNYKNDSIKSNLFWEKEKKSNSGGKYVEVEKSLEWCAT